MVIVSNHNKGFWCILLLVRGSGAYCCLLCLAYVYVLSIAFVVYCFLCVFCCVPSFLSLSDSLRTLDLSGNVSLGNSGALQLLRAYNSRLCLAQDDVEDATTTLSLVACGIESPLPEEFVRMVKMLRSGDAAMPPSHMPFKVDLFGNLIDEKESQLLMS